MLSILCAIDMKITEGILKSVTKLQNLIEYYMLDLFRIIILFQEEVSFEGCISKENPWLKESLLGL